MTALARLTVHGPRRRVDVALPEHVPLAELLPELLGHAGAGLPDEGERHGGWLLRRTDGAPLAPELGLSQQGVRDGEVLHLVPAWQGWPELEYDDVVEAIAAAARRRGAVWGPRGTRVAALVVAGLVAGAALLAVVRAGAGPAGLAVAALLTLCAALAARGYGDAVAGACLGGYAMPFAFAGGALLTGGGAGVPAALAGSAALLLAAALGAAGVAAYPAVFAAGVTAGLLGTVTALIGYRVGAAGAAATLTAALVCGVSALPLVAVRLGRLPVPAVAEEGAPESEPARLPAAVARTDDLLSGLFVGHATLTVVAGAVLVLTGGVAGRLLAGLAALAVLLRARLFAPVRQRLPLLGAGLAVLAALSAALVLAADRPRLLALAAVGVGLALAVVAAGGAWSRRPPSPYLGRAADLLEVAIVVSVVPVACAVLGVYAGIRDLTA
ncbi:type VII secretion integral membrane protein EccD [Rhizomonospora bruguierae]|uniref:type VII secretion integral membrane protein EccD n=1 Tax=Rhizomonospora bruguierae TaxID=1581705 RepID=UPI001BCC5B3B|nr:type VII secretion integral membrane protein EccD [Micromonospora sp. NBRC 107566]